MLKPAGTFSFAVGSLSAAAASGGAATGASFCAASLSGRPIIGEPGGSGDAAGAGAAAGAGGAAGACWAAAAVVNALRNAPASNALRGDRIVVMRVLPWIAAASILAQARLRAGGVGLAARSV